MFNSLCLLTYSNIFAIAFSYQLYDQGPGIFLPTPIIHTSSCLHSRTPVRLLSRLNNSPHLLTLQILAIHPYIKIAFAHYF
jgi:hypothetical protein